MALHRITEHADELEAKKQRLEDISEEDENVAGITSQTSQNHIICSGSSECIGQCETEQFQGNNSNASVYMKGDNQSNNNHIYYDSEPFKGTNSSVSVYRKGDNQSNDCYGALPMDGASGSTEDAGLWNMMEDEDVLIIDPRTEHLNPVSFNIDKQTLPTILEECETEIV